MTTTEERPPMRPFGAQPWAGPVPGGQPDAGQAAGGSASAGQASGAQPWAGQPFVGRHGLNAGAGRSWGEPIGSGLHLTRKFVGRMRVWLIVRGLLGLVLGGLILFNPALTITAFAMIVGIFFCFIGVTRIVVGAADAEFSAGVRVLNVVFGLLLTVLGAIAIRYPDFGLFATVLIIGFAWLIEGGVTLAALPPRHQGRGWTIAFAVISLIAGALVILWPVAALLPLVIVVGVFLMVGGVIDIVNGVLLRPKDRPRPVE